MPRAPPGALLAVLFLVAAVGGAAMYSYFFCVTQLMYIPTSMDKRVLFFWCILSYFSAGLVFWPVLDLCPGAYGSFEAFGSITEPIWGVNLGP